jgi:hypothetical protein
VVARGRFAQDAWEVSELTLDTGEGRIGFTGSLTWADGAPLVGRPRACGTSALAASPGWSGTLTTDSLSLRKLADFAPQAAGAPRLPVGARGAVGPAVRAARRRAREADPARAGARASCRTSTSILDYRDDLLTVRRFSTEQPDSIGPGGHGARCRSVSGGGIPAAERLPDRPCTWSRTRAAVEPGAAAAHPAPRRGRGRPRGPRRGARGYSKHPNLAGSIFVRDGVIRPASREEVLTGVTGTIRLDGPNLTLANFEARQGKQGRITIAKGSGHIRNLRITDYTLDMAVNHFTAFSSGEYVLEFDGKLHVENGVDRGGPMPMPHVTGQIKMIEGQFLTNLADPARQAAWQGPAAAPPWTYRIGIEALKNVWWRPPDANIEAELEEVRDRPDADELPDARPDRGLARPLLFLGNQFDVETGKLFFDASEPMNPTVDATLTTRKPMAVGDEPETITLTVTGRAFEPTVNLTSSPSNLSQSQIAEL